MKDVIKILSLVFLSLLITFGFTGCNPFPEPPPHSEGIDQPENLTVDTALNRFTWSAVENATGYMVRINDGAPISTGANTYYSLDGLTVMDYYSIQVMAVGDGDLWLDSEWRTDFDYGYGFEKLSWTLVSGNDYTVGKGTSTFSEINLPQTYNGKVISGVNFEGDENLEKITIPNTVDKIAANAFRDCISLETVVIADASEIGSRAFQGCVSLKNITFSEKLNKIEGFAFMFCESFESFIFPENSMMNFIGNHAFSSCLKLKEISIPNADTANLFELILVACDALEKVYWEGTESSWNGYKDTAVIGDFPSSTTAYFYSESTPTKSGNFWRYVNGIPKIWA